MPAPKSTESPGFRVALNPRNPEANSWFDPGLGINLFLSSPVSHDLTGHSVSNLRAVARGLRAGLLIVSHGDPPEEMDLSDMRSYGAPRTRWSVDDSKMNEEEANDKNQEVRNAALDAMDNHNRIVERNFKPVEPKILSSEDKKPNRADDKSATQPIKNVKADQ